VVVRGEELLEPPDVVILEGSGQGQRLAPGVGVVGIDHEGHVRSHRLSHRAGGAVSLSPPHETVVGGDLHEAEGATVVLELGEEGRLQLLRDHVGLDFRDAHGGAPARRYARETSSPA
jgi:hypothetical protein